MVQRGQIYYNLWYCVCENYRNAVDPLRGGAYVGSGLVIQEQQISCSNCSDSCLLGLLTSPRGRYTCVEVVFAALCLPIFYNGST